MCNLAGEQVQPDERGGAVAEPVNVERLRSLVAWQLTQAGVDAPTVASVLRCSRATVYRRLAALPERVKRRGSSVALARVQRAG